ncbi:SGNH/GDSL hydrolase family protein [Hymenobacter latericus]|uniref:SGNH/GDSL hydrolase family protein n=1 Tax=Hymenobacter sp. YIM 151858-1 TaxID=2987688 RepID=UPI002225F187|nr:SGNH/GDSL hydrolase family protein [Hymenobacter sp. YIM 151858-1]UYZ58594.1 SGNH/GDSL hydrolase family protein [Hymenobacter sp. YIM 151858-1]
MYTFLKKGAPALALLGLALGSCQPELEEPKADAGSLDFTSYVAIGNSLTAGFQDGGLYNEGIRSSYPALLAEQFGKTGRGPANFVQPLFADNFSDGSGYAKLASFANGTPVIQQPSQANNFLGQKVAYTGRTLPAPPLGSGAPELQAFTGNQPDNLGVPGISVLSADRTASANPLVAGAAQAYGNLNNYYQRILPAADRGTTDYVSFIGRKSATFFTCWMGNNDVLTYATNGGVVDAGNPFSNLTDTTSFGRGYRNIVRTISKNGTVAGVVANIPNVTNVPYFTTVRVADIKARFRAANPNLSLYIQTTGTGGTTVVREATDNDLLTLPSLAVIGTATTGNPFPVGAGLSATAANPLPNRFVLDNTEAASVQTRTTQLNGIIAKTARQYKVALADMNTFFGSVALSGFAINGTVNSASFLSGNLFSLDGVHPTPRGYAVVANEFIRTINTYYGTSIPFTNPNEYRGVVFP